MPALRILALVTLVTLLLPGCVTRFAKKPVSDSGGIRIYLRSQKTFGGIVEKDHEHPAIIAPVRMAHIFARLDVRLRAKDGNRREGAIPTDMLFEMGEGVSAALAEATPDQVVVVMAIHKERHLGIFDDDYLTSLLVYVRDGSLYIRLSRRNWPLDKRRDLELPEPRIGDDFHKFRVQPDIAMAVVDPQSVAVDWRNPIFARATRTKQLPTGEVVRKTILFETIPESLDDLPVTPEMPEGLTPKQLRALADIEEERRAGIITEPQYRARRRDILEGL